MKKIFKWQKTNQKKVFDYIVRYERMNGELPNGRLIARVFNLSPSRGLQYIDLFKNKLK